MEYFQPPTAQERSLYNLERTLIHRHFPGLAARQVKIVEAVDFDGRAKEPRLEVSVRLLGGGPRLKALLTHLLIHYEMKDSGQPHWAGHGPYFARRASELGVYSDTALRRCFSIEEWLDHPLMRSGPHAVCPRAVDVIYGLARCYREELNDFFLNERWTKGGGRVPESLLPWVKFYSEELTDLLAVGVCVAALTH